MVDREIVLATIKKMYESGIEDSIVEQTLQDIGLSQAEIRQCIAEAKGAEPGAGEGETMSAWPKPFEARKEAAEETVDHAAMHSTTHVALEEQASTLAEMLEKMNALEKRLLFFPQGRAMPDSLVSVNQRLGAMEKHLGEIRAGLGATKDIMEKILETDRKILNKL